MTGRYAVIANGVVENVIVWDGQSEYPGSDSLINLESIPWVGPGYTYDGTTFTPPPTHFSTTQ
jgi:hypothetical protein